MAAIVAALAFGYVHLPGQKGMGPQKGAEAPPFSLTSLEGGEVDLSFYRGSVVVLNFWATWCAPCVAEMPSLERLHRSLGPEGLAVVTVSTDEDQQVVSDFVAEHGLTLPVLLDPGGRTAASAYHTASFPATFVLDRQGVLLAHYVGPAEWHTEKALAHFRGLLSPS